MQRVKAALVAALLVLSAGADAHADAAAPNSVPVEAGWSVGDKQGRRADLPAGWRWESYGGLQVGVPGDWGWGDSSSRLHPCLSSSDEQPIVGRATGIFATVSCLVDSSTLIEHTGWVVGFDLVPGADGVEHEGNRTTVRLDGVEVVIQVPLALRRRIAATIHRMRVDRSGCAVTHPIGAQLHLRPAPSVPVTSLRAVTAVSACKYGVRDYAAPRWQHRLISGLRLDGAAAGKAIQQIAQAPRGGGPDNPWTCVPEASYGNEIIVLRVFSAAGPSEIMLRYSGCDHNGFDDGFMLRKLTAAAVTPFIAGPNEVLFFSGQDEKTPMLLPSFPKPR